MGKRCFLIGNEQEEGNAALTVGWLAKKKSNSQAKGLTIAPKSRIISK